MTTILIVTTTIKDYTLQFAYSSSGDGESLGDDGSSPLLSQRSVAVEDNDYARSQVTFDTMDLDDNKEKGQQEDKEADMEVSHFTIKIVQRTGTARYHATII
jgi:hypothetical protein